jgi:hypothetical protein
MHGGISFDVVIPNEETQAAMDEGEDPAALKNMLLSRLYATKLEYKICFQLFRPIALNVDLGVFHVKIKISMN